MYIVCVIDLCVKRRINTISNKMDKVSGRKKYWILRGKMDIEAEKNEEEKNLIL